jgi:hypothetical protein
VAAGIKRTPDLPSLLRDLFSRVSSLETLVRKPRSYTATSRPDAATNEGALIYNLTTRKHQGSNGTTWTDLY